MDPTRHQRIGIVGAGLAGLATAAYLGRAGYRVSVFERAEMLGGRAATVERNGYLHNLGPHALYQGGSATSVLEELGVSYFGGRPDVQGVAVRRGKTFRLPVGGRSLLTTRLFGVRARVEAAQQLLVLRRAAQDAQPMREWLSGVSQPAAREYIEAITRLATYANAPGHISVNDASRQLASSGAGVIYLDGGWQTLVNALRDAAVAAGASVRPGERVARVVAGAPARRLLLANGAEEGFDAVVLAVPPSVAHDLAPWNAALGRHAASAVPARAACLDVGLTKLPNPRRRFALGIDEPFYLSVHSIYAKLAPEGRVMVSAARYIPAGEDNDAERDLEGLERFLDTVQPGWREFEEHRQFLPNMVVSSAVPRFDRGGIAGRPAPSHTGTPGLFVAGDWVGQGGWLADGTLGSAREAFHEVSDYVAAQAERPLAVVS
jgi:phytoene dehydrogenase-like protein